MMTRGLEAVSKVVDKLLTDLSDDFSTDVTDVTSSSGGAGPSYFT